MSRTNLLLALIRTGLSGSFYRVFTRSAGQVVAFIGLPTLIEFNQRPATACSSFVVKRVFTGFLFTEFCVWFTSVSTSEGKFYWCFFYRVSPFFLARAQWRWRARAAGKGLVAYANVPQRMQMCTVCKWGCCCRLEDAFGWETKKNAETGNNSFTCSPKWIESHSTLPSFTGFCAVLPSFFLGYDWRIEFKFKKIRRRKEKWRPDDVRCVTGCSFLQQKILFFPQNYVFSNENKTR